MSTRRHSAKKGSPASAVQLFTPSDTIELRWPAANTRELAKLQQSAIQWTHIVRNRTRWIRSSAGAGDVDTRARDFLHDLGLDETERRQLAEAGTVRVCIPYAKEASGWEARILPWEYLISAGTRDLRTGPVVVKRWLRTGRPIGIENLETVLFVESAPGRLGQNWDFESELLLVKKYTKAKTFVRLVSPTAAALKAAVVKLRPGVIHLAGFDTHQGLQLIGDPRAAETTDGYLLAAGAGVDPVSAASLAEALTPGGFAPSVVFCNFWNSAARVAPLLVAAGVPFAIGFQDGIDDALAEIFLGSFYRALAASKNVDAGFEAGWESLQPQRKPLRGTGIVLWHGGSEKQQQTSRAPVDPPRARSHVALAPEKLSAAKVKDLLAVTVEAEPRFSYGLLHNDRDLFRRFLVRNLSDAPILGLDVFVELHSNEGTYPYRRSFSLDGPVLDLSREVRIALTSNLARTLDEVLRTSLYVEVKWGSHTLFSETFPVRLDPVDQWVDTDVDRVFLPSFVFPRDRAVSTVIKNAELYVTALRDDPTAGFDGYQALDAELANPAENVDRQVQALWYSVVYRVPASYINPPPTYAVASQRIRTPSEVVAGGFGTCIDLALMVASCLEAVEIYPVIFLLNDHAFPGYWRTDKARSSFLRRVAELGNAPGKQGGAGGDGTAARERPGVPWCFDATAFSEIKRAIDGHKLVPLESVGLTGRWSLTDAIAGGREYFDEVNATRFLVMLDVVTAREQGVTPLPLGPRLG